MSNDEKVVQFRVVKPEPKENEITVEAILKKALENNLTDIVIVGWAKSSNGKDEDFYNASSVGTAEKMQLLQMGMHKAVKETFCEDDDELLS